MPPYWRRQYFSIDSVVFWHFDNYATDAKPLYLIILRGVADNMLGIIAMPYGNDIANIDDFK